MNVVEGLDVFGKSQLDSHKYQSISTMDEYGRKELRNRLTSGHRQGNRIEERRANAGVREARELPETIYGRKQTGKVKAGAHGEHEVPVHRLHPDAEKVGLAGATWHGPGGKVKIAMPSARALKPTARRLRSEHGIPVTSKEMHTELAAHEAHHGAEMLLDRKMLPKQVYNLIRNPQRGDAIRAGTEGRAVGATDIKHPRNPPWHAYDQMFHPRNTAESAHYAYPQSSAKEQKAHGERLAHAYKQAKAHPHTITSGPKAKALQRKTARAERTVRGYVADKQAQQGKAQRKAQRTVEDFVASKPRSANPERTVRSYVEGKQRKAEATVRGYVKDRQFKRDQAGKFSKVMAGTGVR